ncbi:hypothetical protein C8J56DRAFT_1163988 [Mycena floridula]|nr:hypothetical protein C8J56DRAFT_1163988 [Mycena floridula]
MPVLTRRAALAQKSILNVLPNELMTEIISLCDYDSQAALCRVSKLFKELSHRILYRIVCLEDVSAITSFDRVVSSNPLYATWVIQLVIQNEDEDNAEATLEATNRILQKTTELQTLVLQWLTTDTPIFAKFSFHRLHELLLLGYVPDPTVVTAFVNRHPKLSRLFTFINREDDPIRLLFDLPDLLGYHGIAPSTLASAPKLRSLHLLIHGPDALDALERFSSCQDLVIEFLLDIVAPDDFRNIFNLLQRHTPQIKSLLLRTTTTSGIFSYQNHIEEGLSGFKQLESFGLVDLNCAASSDELDSTVGLWLKSCSTLRECLIKVLGTKKIRYQIVDGKAQRTTRRCRMEMEISFTVT